MTTIREAPVLTGSDHPEHGSVLFLSVVCLVAALGGFLFGFDTGVISGAIDMLQEQFGLSSLGKGFIVSSVLFGCVFGVSIAGVLSDWLGRKLVLLLSAVLFTVSAAWAALPATATGLVLARFVGGTGIGIASMLAPLYIAEISPPRLRGRFIALYQFAITVGILVTYFSNAWLVDYAQRAAEWVDQGVWRWIFVDEVWRGMFLVGVLPAVFFFLLLLAVPESPRWLTKQGRTQEAMAILARVAGRTQAAQEMDEIQNTLVQEGGSFWQLFEHRLRIPLLIGLILPFFSQIIGINAIIYYGPTIFQLAGFGLAGALGAQIFFGVVNTVFTLIAILFVDKLGRKPLLLTGIAGTGIALALAGYLFHSPVLESYAYHFTLAGPDSTFSVDSSGSLQGLVLILVFSIYLACFAFSFGPVCWIIVAEIFPTRIRGRAMSISIFSLWSGCILVSQTFPYLVENLSIASSFWLYAVTAPGAFLFTLLLVPETKGRTLEQIEARWLH